jgi:hypothetical protein
LAEDWDWKSQNSSWKSFPTRVLQKTLPPLPKTGFGKKKNPVPTEGTNTIIYKYTGSRCAGYSTRKTRCIMLNPSYYTGILYGMCFSLSMVYIYFNPNPSMVYVLIPSLFTLSIRMNPLYTYFILSKLNILHHRWRSWSRPERSFVLVLTSFMLYVLTPLCLWYACVLNPLQVKELKQAREELARQVDEQGATIQVVFYFSFIVLF